MKTIRFIANGVLILGLAAMAAAQATPAPGDKPDEGARGEWKRPDVVGQITAINGQTFSIKNREGHDVTVTLTDATKLMKDRKPAKIADYKVGDMAMVRGHSTGTDTWEAEFVGSRSGGSEGGPGGFGQGLGTKFVAGEIKSIDGTHLTIARPDGQTQTIAVDENTSFLKQRESITLADFKVGDRVFGPGEVKDGTFTASKLILGDPHRMHGDPEGNQGPEPKPEQK